MERMQPIPVGAQRESTLAVTSENAISFLGDDRARVLGTPWLIAYLEMTARELVKPYLLDGQDTVGTQVNVRHLAATPMGMVARFRAEVTEVSGRRITFRVEAFDRREKIADGTHERAIIEVSRFMERLQLKREK